MTIVSVTPIAAGDPLAPSAAQRTFKLLPGFKIELVASEPEVVDPVAMAFDERGRLFVCEMRGYPNGGVATGPEKRGRIRCLTDENNDGHFEKSVIYADGLRFPTGVLPWRGGVIVCNAPDLIYLPDDNKDNKADIVRVLYTGFGLDNIQQILNSPRWGIDNWVYALNGSVGGTITCPDKPDMQPLVLRGRGIRFRPEIPGSIEPTSGGGQYGLTCDEAGHWFTATNSQHLRQIVLPDPYLRRNPYYAAPATTLDIPEHGAACKVFRISPFEDWRVERTARRKDGPEAKRLPATELVPGGYITSACSPCYYGPYEPLFPEKDRVCVYVCDPANNLVTRDKLQPKGSIYKGVRIDDGVEFLASTDNWFRPVHLTIGPEGALYICDFYREVIETPLSLPDDIKKRLNLESRERGRIWRVTPDGGKTPALAKLEKLNSADRVIALRDPHVWIRNTAQRLLFERPLTGVPDEALVDLKKAPATTLWGYHLWALREYGVLSSEDLRYVLDKGSASDRIHALRLAETLVVMHPELAKRVLQCADDPSSFVRFQLALSVGQLDPGSSGPILAKLLRHKDSDSWLEAAVLSSAKDCVPALLESLTADADYVRSHPAMLGRLAAMIGARDDDKLTGRALQLLAKLESLTAQAAILDGLGQGSRNSTRPLSRLWDNPSAELKPAIAKALTIFTVAAASAQNEEASTAARLAAIRLLAAGPFRAAAEPLAGLFGPRSSNDLQSAALRSLASFDDASVPEIVLSHWPTFSPTLRREATEVMLARPERVARLLDAIEGKKVLAAHLESSRVDELRKHKDPAIRDRAARLLAGQIAGDRKRVLDDYQGARALKADAARGRELFRKNCTACHRLENTGFEVGANLTAALRNKTKDALLIDILDPSREVDSRYVNYQITTTASRTITGILAVETPTSITLRRGDKAEDTILRSQIDEIRATSKSLMPEEFEKQLNKQDVADLIEYLLSTAR